MDFASMPLAQWTGYLAGVLTSVSYAPQVWKTWRTRDTSALSTRMTILLSLGLGLWVLYGLQMKSWPIVIFNSFSILLSVSLLTMKKLFERGKKKPPRRRSTDNVHEFPKRAL